MNENNQLSNRMDYLDIARGLAVFFMIMQHAMIMFEKTGGEGRTIIGNLFLLLGTAPAAPVFLFIMGIFTAKSNKGFKEICKRGLKLFVLGYGLNLIRFTIPLSIAAAVKISHPLVFPSINGTPSQIFHYAMLLFFTVDIFQVAGLSLIFFACLKKVVNHLAIIPLFILIILVASPYLWEVGTSMSLVNPFWGNSDLVDFPLFPWGVYFLLGMYLSQYFKESYMSKSRIKSFVIAAAALALIGFATMRIFPVGDYYRSGLSVHCLMLAFILLWLPICNRITTVLKKRGYDRSLEMICSWSKNVTGIYIFQWIVFGWGILMVGSQTLPDYGAMLAGFVVVCLCQFATKKGVHYMI